MGWKEVRVGTWRRGEKVGLQALAVLHGKGQPLLLHQSLFLLLLGGRCVLHGAVGLEEGTPLMMEGKANKGGWSNRELWSVRGDDGHMT